MCSVKLTVCAWSGYPGHGPRGQRCSIDPIYFLVVHGNNKTICVDIIIVLPISLIELTIAVHEQLAFYCSVYIGLWHFTSYNGTVISSHLTVRFRFILTSRCLSELVPAAGNQVGMALRKWIVYHETHHLSTICTFSVVLIMIRLALSLPS